MAEEPANYQLEAARFLEMVKAGDLQRLEAESQRLRNAASNIVNWRERATGMTPLHYAAGQDSVALLRILLTFRNIDYTAKDNKGRTAATLAIEVADNPAVGRLLLKKEFAMAGNQAAAGLATRA